MRDAELERVKGEMEDELEKKKMQLMEVSVISLTAFTVIE